MNVTIYIVDKLLVEFLAKEENQGFSRPGEFWGPYPSGAPVIFADQVVELGFGSMLFNCVGNDVLGEMNIARLERDGVNVNGTATLQKATTGGTFVSYRSQTQRDSISNMPNSAYGLLTANRIDEAPLNQCQHFRTMGSSPFSFRIIGAMCKAIENIKGHNSMVSFDPSICKEVLDTPEISQVFEYILDYTDILLPSDSELGYFGLNPERNEQILVNSLLKHGVKHVVIKYGSRGASYFSVNEIHHVAGFNVLVVDPTGTGDCFGATFASLFLNGTIPQKALRWMNASGSLATSQRDPTEDASTQAQIRASLATRYP